ncbi:unnamed protein product [Paramecium octaurelia]|uniref:non-specific serine/threonine protein kinase n=1 Tax=Paramecium octaurelia TaxID=43137 RepID=A0A8S1V8Y2_PAROT|nr:unnamed protein product [Paramecium octaurelia]
MNRLSVSDFEIIKKLGQGSFSSVYKVKRKSDGQEYAMKKVQMSGLATKELNNALNEVRILASLENPYIIGYREAFIRGDNLFIVLEYAGGGDLQQKLEYIRKKGQGFYVDEELIWTYSYEMLSGLSELHSKGIYHRDIKCANIFLSQDHKHIKLGDLNVAKVVKANQFANTYAGTPYYASPEVWMDQPYDQKCDIWSLGCVIYEMAQLQPPFLANDLFQLQKKISKGQYDPLNPRYSKELSEFVAKCLQIASKNRASCEELLNLIQIRNRQNSVSISYSNQKLLGTICLTKNYKEIRLPRPRYQTEINDSSVVISKIQTSRGYRAISNNRSDDSNSPASRKFKIKNKLSNHQNSLERNNSQNDQQSKENIRYINNLYQLQPNNHQHYPSAQEYKQNTGSRMITPMLRKQLSSPLNQKSPLNHKSPLKSEIQQDIQLPKLKTKQLILQTKDHFRNIRKLI